MIGDGSLAAPLLLGITYAALPGVVNTEAFRRGVRSGFLPAASIQIGALIGDGLWAAVALTGAALLLQHDLVALTLGLAGAGFLFHLARPALTGALRGTPAQTTTACCRSYHVAGLDASYRLFRRRTLPEDRESLAEPGVVRVRVVRICLEQHLCRAPGAVQEAGVENTLQPLHFGETALPRADEVARAA
jgi:hypothetical protein